MGVSSQRRSRFERATRSLATFVRSHRSFRSLAPQRSVHGLAHSLRSLPRGMVETLKSVFTLKSRFRRTIEILVVTRNTPIERCQPLKWTICMRLGRESAGAWARVEAGLGPWRQGLGLLSMTDFKLNCGGVVVIRWSD